MLKRWAPSMYAFGVVSTIFAGAYWLSNELTSLRADVGTGGFVWGRQIPFVAWTIVPCLSIFFLVSFFLGPDRIELQRQSMGSPDRRLGSDHLSAPRHRHPGGVAVGIVAVLPTSPAIAKALARTFTRRLAA